MFYEATSSFNAGTMCTAAERLVANTLTPATPISLRAMGKFNHLSKEMY